MLFRIFFNFLHDIRLFAIETISNVKLGLENSSVMFKRFFSFYKLRNFIAVSEKGHEINQRAESGPRVADHFEYAKWIIT